MFNILIVGDNNVGKTSLCQTYLNGAFTPSSTPTLLATTHTEMVNLDNRQKRVKIHELSGI